MSLEKALTYDELSKHNGLNVIEIEFSFIKKIDSYFKNLKIKANTANLYIC